MPHVLVKLVPGKTEEQKRALTDAISQSVQQHLGSTEDEVSVAFEEVPMEQWAETVYRPEIVGCPDKIYKKPGYTL